MYRNLLNCEKQIFSLRYIIVQLEYKVQQLPLMSRLFAQTDAFDVYDLGFLFDNGPVKWHRFDAFVVSLLCFRVFFIFLLAFLCV